VLSLISPAPPTYSTLKVLEIQVDGNIPLLPVRLGRAGVPFLSGAVIISRVLLSLRVSKLR
jgi:hypothetical protein